jgi:hypothetical protein
VLLLVIVGGVGKVTVTSVLIELHPVLTDISLYTPVAVGVYVKLDGVPVDTTVQPVPVGLYCN